MKHTTLTDIANKLGLSPSTVSRALNDHPDINLETKKEVKRIAEELRYSPNPIARSLRNNRTSTIAVLVPEIKHDFFSHAISGIEEVAYERGYTIILCQSNETVEREVINVNALIQHRVAGVVVSISQETKTGEHFQVLIDRKIPLVFFDRVCEDVPASKVIIDDEKSALAAVTHLTERGYKKIAHFAGPKELDICRKRLSGYRSALSAASLPLIPELVVSGGLHETDGYRSMSLLLSTNLIPDAIFCVNDPVAVGAFQRIKEAGLRIPKDIALVGFSNNKISGLIDPPLTTIDQPSFEMGKRAAQILIDIIEEKTAFTEPQTVVLDATLIIRAST